MLFDRILLFRSVLHTLVGEILTREMTMMIFNDDIFNDGTRYFISVYCGPQVSEYDIDSKVYSAWQGKSDFISISTRLCVILV